MNAQHLRKFIATAVVAMLVGCGAKPLNTDEAPKSASPEFVAASQVAQEKGLEFRKSPIAVGDPAPSLELPDQKGILVSVRELSMSQDTLLIFFPGSESPEARPVYDWVRKNRAFAATHQCEVVLVNARDGVGTNDKIAAVEQLKVAVLADQYSAMARSYGVVQPYTARSLDRVWSVVVGKSGVVLSAQPGLPATGDLVTTLKVTPRPSKGFGVLDVIME